MLKEMEVYVLHETEVFSDAMSAIMRSFFKLSLLFLETVRSTVYLLDVKCEFEFKRLGIVISVRFLASFHV